MEVYRISRQKYIRDLSGEGARIHGGRWNHKGHSVLYTSEYESLATLEILVHTPINSLPQDLWLLTLYIPDNVSAETIERNSLPSDWRTYPAPNKLADLGTRWIRQSSSLTLSVPSVITSSESNILINPHHPEFSNLEIKDIREFKLDGRLIE